MKTLRLLLWLRWKLFLRATTSGNRFATIALNVLFALVFSPFWVGGALGAYGGTLRYGAPVALVAYGLCQFGWLYLGVLSGALGRSFDLDAWLRWPVRPRTVYAFNVLASFLEPVCLMTMPTLAALALAAGQRAGLLAGLVTALAGLLTTLITAALLQLLLAVLDEMLRRPIVRHFATLVLPLTIVGVQLSLRRLLTGSLLGVAHQKLTPEQGLALAENLLGKLPTIAGPAAMVRAALGGGTAAGFGGFALALAILAALLAPGAALMRRTARGGESGGGGPARAARPTRGSFAWPLPFLPHRLALLVTRELRYTFLNPQRLISLIVTPLVVMFFYTTQSRATVVNPLFVLAMMSSAISTASMLLFSYDGPGIRSFWLLPISARDAVLAKNLEFLGRSFVQLLIVFGTLTFFVAHLWTLVTIGRLLAAMAVLGVIAAVGTRTSIRNPVRARQRGMMNRSAGTGWGGLWVFLAAFACALLCFGSISLVGRFAPPAWNGPLSLATGALWLAVGFGIWWRSLDFNAGALRAGREKLIEVIGKLDAE